MTSTSLLDFFAVLQLKPACEIDLALLEKNYQQQQSLWHPDRKAGASDREKLEAMQQASILNDAYTTLKNPLLRAAHLLQLNGIDVSSHDQSYLDPAFLLAQIHLHDTLEECQANANLTGLQTLIKQTKMEQQEQWLLLCQVVAVEDYEQARRIFYKMQFMQRLQEAIRIAEDHLLGY